MTGKTRPSLREIELLRSLTDVELEPIAQRCRWQRFAPGQAILDRRSHNRDVFFVVAGRVRAVDYSPSGREVVFATIGPGGHFGELSAIDGLERSAAVVAIDACLLAALPPEQFESLVRRHPDVALALLRRLVRIVRTTDERLTELVTVGAMARVCRELLRLAEFDEAAQAWQVVPLPTQRDLAARAGTTRETVARTLSQLTREHLVRRAGRILRIADRRALEAAIAHLQSGGEGSS